jgi:hypothetical protein
MKLTKFAARGVAIGLMSGAIIAGATGCGTSSTPSAAGVQSACAALGGTVGPDQICHAHSATPNYAVDVRFPVDYPDQQALIDAITKERGGFIDWVAQSVPRSFPYELNIVGHPYRSGTPSAGTQSLVFHVGSDTGVHPVTTYKALNYDLSKHVPITFDTLFRPGSQPLEVLNPIVQRELDKHEAAQPLNDLNVAAYQNFAITDDTVIFFFDQDGLLPHEDGPLDVSVPRADLPPLLA